MPSPFDPNMKLEALHATITLEKARLDSGEESTSAEELTREMEVIHKWLTEE